MPAVAFDPAAFKARYPEFSVVSAPVLSGCFAEAGLYLSNTDTSPVQDLVRRAMLLQMLTAHIAFLGGALSGDGQARPVGRVSTASEGSVSAGFEYTTPGTQAWFVQSQYGAAAWQALLPYRSFRYIPPERQSWR